MAFKVLLQSVSSHSSLFLTFITDREMESREVQLLAQSPLLGPKLQVRNNSQASCMDITFCSCVHILAV